MASDVLALISVTAQDPQGHARHVTRTTVLSSEPRTLPPAISSQADQAFTGRCPPGRLLVAKTCFPGTSPTVAASQANWWNREALAGSWKLSWDNALLPERSDRRERRARRDRGPRTRPRGAGPDAPRARRSCRHPGGPPRARRRRPDHHPVGARLDHRPDRRPRGWRRRLPPEAVQPGRARRPRPTHPRAH